MELDTERDTDSLDVVKEEPVEKTTRVDAIDVVMTEMQQVAIEIDGPIQGVVSENWISSDRENSISVRLDTANEWTVLSMDMDVELVNALPIRNVPYDQFRLTGFRLQLDSVLVTHNPRPYIIDAINDEGAVMELSVTHYGSFGGGVVRVVREPGQGKITLHKKSLSDGNHEIVARVTLQTDPNLQVGQFFYFIQLNGTIFIEY